MDIITPVESGTQLKLLLVSLQVATHFCMAFSLTIRTHTYHMYMPMDVYILHTSALCSVKVHLCHDINHLSNLLPVLCIAISICQG